MPIQPIDDYTDVEHCKQVAPTFVHPGNGNIYTASVEKRKGVLTQDLVIRRMPPTLPARWEEVKRYRGGIDAVGAFDMGGAVISRHGVLVTTFTCQPKDHPLYKPDGFPKFQSCWDWLPGVDDPWLTDPDVEELKAQIAGLQAEREALAQRVAALAQRVAEIETALANVSTGPALAPEDEAALDWVKRETKALG